jgi:hypothetical protein
MMSLFNKRWVVVVAAILFLPVSWAAGCYVLLSHPAVDHVTNADAIVVLGEPTTESLVKATRLAAAGVSDELVISAPAEEPSLCATPPPHMHVTCFNPQPSTTRGEARKIRQLADKYDWKNVVVITWTEHISRARYVIERCFDGALQLVDYDATQSIHDLLRAWMYETAAFVKATFQSGC